MTDGESFSIPTKQEQIDAMIQHYHHIIAFYGEHTGVRIGRKHLHWYREVIGLDNILVSMINSETNSMDLIQKIKNLVYR